MGWEEDRRGGLGLGLGLGWSGMGWSGRGRWWGLLVCGTHKLTICVSFLFLNIESCFMDFS